MLKAVAIVAAFFLPTNRILSNSHLILIGEARVEYLLVALSVLYLKNISL